MEQTIKKFINYLDECLYNVYKNEEIEIKEEILLEKDNNSEINKISLDICARTLFDLKCITEDIRNKLMKFQNFEKIIKKYELCVYFIEETKRKLQLSEEEIKNDKNYFDLFSILSDFLLESQLNSYEKKSILFYFIEQSSKNLLYSTIIKNKTFKMLDIISNEILEKDIELNNINRIKLNVNSIYNIKKHYFEKQDSYDKCDVDEIISSLKKLGVNDKLCDIVNSLLLKEIKKRNKSDIKINFKMEEVKKVNLITDKEYKNIKKELRDYFDFYNVKAIRKLTNEEIIHCIDLLIKIGTPIEEINRFIFLTQEDNDKYKNEKLLDEKNPISLFIELYNKLKYYEKVLETEDNMKNIEEYIQEMLVCTDEYYDMYKSEIYNELKKILALLPSNYGYEISEMQKKYQLK